MTYDEQKDYMNSYYAAIRKEKSLYINMFYDLSFSFMDRSKQQISAPDFLVCYQGKFFGIETKAGKGKTTALQELNLKKIIDCGGVALVVREEDVKYLKSLLTTGEEHEESNSSK